MIDNQNIILIKKILGNRRGMPDLSLLLFRPIGWRKKFLTTKLCCYITLSIWLIIIVEAVKVYVIIVIHYTDGGLTSWADLSLYVCYRYPLI